MEQNCIQEERLVFSRNLIILLEQIHNITAFCEEIGIARTQLARFLDGSAHPKLHVLSRICRYFDVDARILLEPLAAVQNSSRFSHLLENIKRAEKKCPLAQWQTNPPNGMYLFWKESAAKPGEYACFPALIKTQNNQKIWKAYDFWSIYDYNQYYKPLHRRLITGFIFEQQHGFSMLEFTAANNKICYSFFYPIEPFEGEIFLGSALLGRKMEDGIAVYHKFILEKIEGTQRELMREARRAGYYKRNDLPRHILANLA